MENEWTEMKNFTPYGDEWKAEMMKFKKAEIIKILGDGLMKLEAERDADRRREYGYSQQTVDALTVERDKLEAENKRLREALDRIESMATIENTEIQKIAREALSQEV